MECQWGADRHGRAMAAVPEPIFTEPIPLDDPAAAAARTQIEAALHQDVEHEKAMEGKSFRELFDLVYVIAGPRTLLARVLGMAPGEQIVAPTLTVHAQAESRRRDTLYLANLSSENTDFVVAPRHLSAAEAEVYTALRSGDDPLQPADAEIAARNACAADGDPQLADPSWLDEEGYDRDGYPALGLWRHYKGGLYEVLGHGTLTNTEFEGTKTVLYRTAATDGQAAGAQVYVRTLGGQGGWVTATPEGLERFVYLGDVPARTEVFEPPAPTIEPALTPADESVVGAVTPVISDFSGPYRFLSNFSPATVTFEGRQYPSVEHAFAAAKTLDEGRRAEIATAPSPGAAKRMGRTVALRADWEEIKDAVMTVLVLSKFSDPRLAASLRATDGAYLVEGNTWHDQIWGDCHCPRHAAQPGENRLGQLLMRVREILCVRAEAEAAKLARPPRAA